MRASLMKRHIAEIFRLSTAHIPRERTGDPFDIEVAGERQLRIGEDVTIDRKDGSEPQTFRIVKIGDMTGRGRTVTLR